MDIHNWTMISIIVSITELWTSTIVANPRYSYPNMDIQFSVMDIYDQIMDTKIMDTVIKEYI